MDIAFLSTVGVYWYYWMIDLDAKLDHFISGLSLSIISDNNLTNSAAPPPACKYVMVMVVLSTNGPYPQCNAGNIPCLTEKTPENDATDA